MRMRWALCWVLVLLQVFLCVFAQEEDDFKGIMKLVGGRIMKDRNEKFFRYHYGSSIIIEALWEATSRYKLKYASYLKEKLDFYEFTKDQPAYNFLNNISMPFDATIGDRLGLFPIAYLARVKYYSQKGSSSYRNQTDINVAQLTADNYLLKFPNLLPDGTVFRKVGWSGEPTNGTFLWADDLYMGSALLAKLSIALNRRDYVDSIVGNQISFIRLQDRKTGLYHHGFNYLTKHKSCCKWARANGWMMMSHIEVLQALSYFPKTPIFNSVLEVLVNHSFALKKVQDDSGLWHQVLDRPETFLETSATAMYLWSMISGVQNGWLQRADFDPVIRKAWKGLKTTIQSDGTVKGISVGTNIGANVTFYQERSTDYESSSPGLGSVLRAILALPAYVQ